MNSVTSLRRQIEHTLARRVPAPFALRGRAQPEVIVCGNPTMDELLGGGLPMGVITEFVGSECSGRTSMALSYMAAVTRNGNVLAWVDAADMLDPECAAVCGVDLERLLWVRCGPDMQTSTPSPSAPSDDLPVRAVASAASPPVRGGGSPHPRSEGRDMPQAISSMLHAHGGLHDRQMRREKKTLGTPGAPNRPLTFRSADREEQVASDRVPARRGEQSYGPRCAEPQPKRAASVPTQQPQLAVSVTSAPLDSGIRRTNKPWQSLDQALRATDLLLQNGGFSAIVLDLGNISPEFAWRIPLATWFRFRAACERTRVSLLLLTQHPCARSAAELVVRMDSGSMDAEGRVMTGIRHRAETERQRSQPESRQEKLVPIRKPPQSERGRWRGNATWAQGK